MIKLFLFIVFISSSALANSGESLLNSSAVVEGFGNIKYRGPVVDSDKLPLVLFHGIYGGASHRTWRQLVAELDGAGERVFIMDLPGIGESDKPKRPYAIEDMDLFVERFLESVVQQRATLVSESLLSASVLRVTASRPDLIRRTILLGPTGLTSLNAPPSEREQRLYDRLYNDDEASQVFYQNLLVDNSLSFFLKFGFYDDSLVNDDLLNDYRVMRDVPDQRFLTISFVGGQLYRPFEESAQGVFLPVLAIFGAEYENFQDNPISTAADFAAVRPDFTYVEIEESGGSVQREKPAKVAEEIILFSQDI